MRRLISVRAISDMIGQNIVSVNGVSDGVASHGARVVFRVDLWSRFRSIVRCSWGHESFGYTLNAIRHAK